MIYTSPGIEGWTSGEELDWLYQRARGMRTVAEIGCYKGRSTHALLSAGAHVIAVDHFRGSKDEPEHAIAAENDGIYRDFERNVGHFPNLSIMRMASLEAAAMFGDGVFDMVFIDASHKYEDVKADILAWGPKARRLLCGHDYCASWPGVMQAVRETVGPFQACGTIWFIWFAG